MENEIIKRFDEKFGELIEEDTMWHFNKAGMNEIKQFFLCELKALKEECQKEWEMRDCDINEDTGELEEWKANFLLGYNNHMGVTFKAFQKRGI